MFSLRVAVAPPEEGEGAAGTVPSNPTFSVAQQWTFTAADPSSTKDAAFTGVVREVDNFVGPEGLATILIDNMLPAENANFVAAMSGDSTGSVASPPAAAAPAEEAVAATPAATDETEEKGPEITPAAAAALEDGEEEPVHRL